MKNKVSKMLHLSSVIIFIGLFGGIGQAAAGEPMYFCIGEKHTSCSIQPVYDCYTSADGIAQGLCTATTAQGKKQLPYILTSLGHPESGHRCGYHKYRVECITDDLKNTSAAMEKFKGLETDSPKAMQLR